MQRKLSRREFLYGAGIGLTAAALAACATATPAPTEAPSEESAPTDEPSASPTEPPEPTQAPPEAPAPTQAPSGETPVDGGTYRVYATGVSSFDPPAAEIYADWWSVAMVIGNTLYAYDVVGKLLPELAADLPKMSDDALVYTIPLRKGVRFHNGREMVADDVKFSLERTLWPEVYCWSRGFLSNVMGYQDVVDGTTKDLAGVKVLDPYTIEITLAQPQAIFLLILTVATLVIVPKQECLDAGDDWGSKIVILTGPFTFGEWKAGQYVAFERNPDYFKPGLPHLDRIELYYELERDVALMRAESNELEFTKIPGAQLGRFLDDPQYENVVSVYPALGLWRLWLHMGVPPTNDKRVRQAIYQAIDRSAFIQVEGGRWIPLDSLYLPQMPQFNPDFRPNVSYDPEAARQLLADAGYESGLTIQMFGGPADVRQQLVQQDLAKVGITVELIPSSGDSAQWERERRGDVQLALAAWGASFPDAYDLVNGWMICSSGEGHNYGQYCNEQVDQLVADAEKLPALSEERTALYRQIEEIVVNEDAAMFPLAQDTNAVLKREYVHGDDLHLIYQLPIPENVWMEPREG